MLFMLSSTFLNNIIIIGDYDNDDLHIIIILRTLASFNLLDTKNIL